MPEIDFAKLQSDAAALIDATPADTPIVDAAPAPVADKAATPEVVPPVAAEVVPPPVDELDPEKDGNRLVKVKVDGEWQTMPLKDVTSGYSRTSHFTRQMQDLAAQRKEVEAKQSEHQQLLTERQQVNAFLANPQLVMKYLQQQNPALFETAQQQPVGQPDEIATVAQAQELIARQAAEMQANLQQMKRDFDQSLQKSAQALKDERETAQHAEVLNATVKDIFDKNPILKNVPLAEDVIRFEVAKMNPKTQAEAKDFFYTVAKGIVENLEQGFTNLNKTKVVAKQKLETKSIEPPGGSGPQIQPTTYKKADGSTDWNKLKSMALDLANTQ